jgi:hypothetical protein
VHDVISFLKTVPSRGAATGLLGCYISLGGSLYAKNDTFQVGIEYDLGADFAASSDAIDAALSRMKEVKAIDIGENTLTLKSGRLRSEIRVIDPNDFPLIQLPDDWQGSPKGLTAAIDAARKFVGDRVWTAGVRLWAGRVTACNPAQALIDIDVKGLSLERPYLLPAAAAAFLVEQGDPDEIGPSDNTIAFRWSDGRWMSTKLLDFEMPEDTFIRLFEEKLGSETPTAVNDEWRAAVADAEALGDGSLRLTAEGLQARKDNIITDVNVDLGLPDDHKSAWSTKGLSLMSSVATAWNPLSYPNPALFVGKGVRGAVVATHD